MIGVIDYGAGNLRSVGNALDHLGLPWSLVADAAALPGCARVILPGVGHFGSAMHRLEEIRMVAPLREWAGTGRPLLGVCLGAQLLLESSAEAPGVRGIGLLAGCVERLTTATIPHMGWNRASPRSNAALFGGSGEYFYFAHSFVCAPADAADVAATVTCDQQTFCVAIERGRVFGVQFHPEKSAITGLELLRRFATC